LVAERQRQAAVAIAVNSNRVRPAINAMKYTSSDHSIFGSDRISSRGATRGITKYYFRSRCELEEDF
jgi:hypothetical protein